MKTYTSKTSGKWHNPSTWIDNLIPEEWSDIIINHTVTFEKDIRVGKLIINSKGVLKFDTNKNLVSYHKSNIIRHGRFIAKPKTELINHIVQFVGIDESKFAGAMPMDMHNIPDSDVGFWNCSSYPLEFQGKAKKHFYSAKQDLKAGDLFINLTSKPTGALIGDEIVITPTEPITVRNNFKNFDIVRIKSISGSTIFLDSPLKFNHPLVYNKFTKKYYSADIINTTRNVKIQGEPNHRGHIHFMGAKENLKYVEISYMGVPDKLGRYPLHFHHAGDKTIGGKITGVVIKYSGNHGFVTHASNGVTFINCVTFDTLETPYWWDDPISDYDPSNNSNNITYDNCIAALVRCDPPYRGYRMASFEMQTGKGNVCINCIAVGNQSINGSGFNWGEKANMMDNVWVYENNKSYNNAGKAHEAWQNDSNNHQFENSHYYNNLTGIAHGAYRNNYKFLRIYLIGNGTDIFQHALSTEKGETKYGYHNVFEEMMCTSKVVITRHLIETKEPVLYFNCVIPILELNEMVGDIRFKGLFDFVDCNLLPGNVNIVSIHPDSVYRFQNGNEAWEIRNGKVNEGKCFFEKIN